MTDDETNAPASRDDAAAEPNAAITDAAPEPLPVVAAVDAVDAEPLLVPAIAAAEPPLPTNEAIATSEALAASATRGTAPQSMKAWKKWAFALVPAWGIFELLAHAKQTRSVVPESDWKDAKAAVEAIAKPDDLVLFAPRWSDPLGREWFGDKLAPIEHEARADESRFPRAIEVSMRGKHRPEIASWKPLDSKRVGAFTITTFENPALVKIVDDLLDHAEPTKMHVQRIDAGREADCNWIQGSAQTGGLGFGPAVPAHRFACSGGNFVGVSVILDLDNNPRRCFYAPPGGGSSILRVKFTDVAFGRALHGHAGMAYLSERDLTGPPITLAWRVGDKALGRIVHKDGDGWKSFELETSDLAGQRGELIAEITSTSSNYRHYCFEADTR